MGGHELTASFQKVKQVNTGMINQNFIPKLIYKNNAWRTVSIITLVILSAFIRLHHLDHESLWMDELRQVSYYPLSIAQVIQGAAEQSQPPLDYLVGHYIHRFSQTDFAVRLPSALFGIGSVFLMTIVVAKLGNLPIALLTGLIFALLPFNIYYSQEARPYAIAVFLFLAVLWALDKSVSADHKHLKNYIRLFLFSALFLYSRALSPLVVVIAFLFILLIQTGYNGIRREENRSGAQQQALLLTMSAFVLALIVYAPSFLYVVKKSGQYLSDDSLLFGSNNLWKGLKSLDLSLAWKVFAVQTEPLTVPLACLLLLSPYVAWKMRIGEQNKLYIISLTVLPISLLFHMIIFHGKTNLPFRPPYAIYLLPLSLILASVSMKGIWEISATMKKSMLIRSMYIIFVIFSVIVTGKTALALKNNRIKSDWRGVSNYLNTHTDSKQVLIYKSLKAYGRPTFNGFFRYYTHGTELISISQIPYLPLDSLKTDREPVIILFQFREYYLTPDSNYPILPLAKTYTGMNVKEIENEAIFDVKRFKGFYVIRLKQKNGSFIHDTYTIMTTLMDYLPENSLRVEFQLAAAALAKLGNFPEWDHHLEQAKLFSGKIHQGKVETIGAYIRALK